MLPPFKPHCGSKSLQRIIDLEIKSEKTLSPRRIWCFIDFFFNNNLLIALLR